MMARMIAVGVGVMIAGKTPLQKPPWPRACQFWMAGGLGGGAGIPAAVCPDPVGTARRQKWLAPFGLGRMAGILRSGAMGTDRCGSRAPQGRDSPSAGRERSVNAHHRAGAKPACHALPTRLTRAFATGSGYGCAHETREAKVDVGRDTFKCGPYPLAPVVNFHAIVEEVPCEVSYTVNIKDPNRGERLLARVFDPDEEVVHWTYMERDDFKDPSRTRETVVLRKPGTYEFRFCGGLCNSTVALESDRMLEYGFSWQNGALLPFAEKPTTMFVYVPRGLDFLTLRPGTCDVTIDTGRETVVAGKGETKQIAITEPDTVWRATFPGAGLRVALDMPMVFCATEKAARRIKNAVEVADDGSWICFAAQKKIPGIMRRLWDKKYVGEPDNVIVPLASVKDKLLSDPVTYGSLIGPWGLVSQVPALLREQDRLNGKLPITHLEALSVSAGTYPEVNPYYHKKEIVYRVAVGLLHCLYDRLGEDEVLSVKPGTDTSLPAVSNGAYKRSTHADCWQSVVCYDTAVVAGAFGPIGRELAKLDPEAYGVIRSLMGRMIDRALPTETHTTASKEMNYPMAIWQFYEATGEERYKQAALRYEYYLIEHSAKAGYSVQYGGPCNDYQKQILSQLAALYRWSNDEKILAHIRTIYTLFNHTVAPEPNNKVIGASSFCHSTVGGFERGTQGMWLLADRLPEAAVWMANYYDNRKAYAENSKKEIIRTIDSPSPADDVLLGHIGWQPAFTSVSLPDAARVHAFLDQSGYGWPALEKNDFTRNFGDEFICVKRKGYYVCVYVGKPLPNVPDGIGNMKYLRRIQDSAKTGELPDWAGDESKLVATQPVEGNPNADFAEFRRLRCIGNIIGYSGGTIALFWSKDYGTSVLGYNVAPTTRHGLILTDPSGDRWWDDYAATEFTLDEREGILRVRGRIENQPVKYERTYEFKADHLEYALTLCAEATVAAASLVENFPVAMKYKASKGREKEESVDLAKADFNGQAAVRMTSRANGRCVLIVNDKGLDATILPDYVGGQGSVQFQLPARLEPGREWRAVFSVVPMGLDGVGP